MVYQFTWGRPWILTLLGLKQLWSFQIASVSGICRFKKIWQKMGLYIICMHVCYKAPAAPVHDWQREGPQMQSIVPTSDRLPEGTPPFDWPHPLAKLGLQVFPGARLYVFTVIFWEFHDSAQVQVVGLKLQPLEDSTKRCTFICPHLG